MLLKYIKMLLPFAALLLSVGIWGALPTLTKIALNDMSVAGFVATRFIFSSLLLLPCLAGVIRRSAYVPIRYWLGFTMIISIMFYSQTWAIEQVSASFYIVIFSITPVIMALCLRYKMEIQAIIGTVMLMIYLYVFLSDGHESGQWHAIAMLAVIVGMLSWILYSVFINKLHSYYNDSQITAVTCYIAAVTNVLVWLGQGDMNLAFISLHGYYVSAVTGIALPIAFFCYSYAMRYQPRFSIFGQYFEPVFGLVIASLMLGGTLTIKQYLAFVFILASVFVVTKYSSAREAPYSVNQSSPEPAVEKQ